jgi:dynein heavy chain
MNSDTPPNKAEWNYFLKGGEVLDRASQPPKPQGSTAEWLTQQMWDNITELENVSETFKSIS